MPVPTKISSVSDIAFSNDHNPSENTASHDKMALPKKLSTG